MAQAADGSERPRPDSPAESPRDDDTVAYAPGLSTPVSGINPAPARGPNASTAEYPFLEPPRDGGGELGWLAHYRIRRLIGSGGMGLVFLADDVHLGRPVALKVIRPELASVPQAAARFSREARAAAAIKDDNIVTVYQVGEAAGVAYLAMEYLQGISLQRWLERGKRPSVDLILRLARETAGGLAAAHKLGLVHRDIKPGNLWLEAPQGRLKILDFGQARAEREDIQITQSGAIMGTPAFMSPEQASGETVEASSDLFSLGCVLYRLSAGRLPFQGKTILAVLNALSNITPPRPRELNPEIPERLDSLIMALLAKNPAERPGSALEVLNELREIERQLVVERQATELAVPAPAPPPRPVSSAAPPPIALADLDAHDDSDASDHDDMAAAPPLPPRNLSRPPNAADSSFAHRGWIAAAAAVAVLTLAGLAIAVLQRGTPGTGNERLAPTTVGSTTPLPAPAVPLPPMIAEPAPPVVKSPPKPPVESPVDVAVEPAPTPPMNTLSGDPAQPGSTELVWGQFVDPDGDSRFSRSEDGTEAALFVPGTAHALSAEIQVTNAPRLLQPIKEDFTISVRVRGSDSPAGRPTLRPYPAAYHGAGLLVWQDEANYLRLEVAGEFERGKPKPRRYINWEYRKDGKLNASHGQDVDPDVQYVRIERRGALFVAAYSADGREWTAAKSLATTLPDELFVGLVAINTATKPLEAIFDEFQVIHGDPEPVSPSAPVQVVVKPSKDVYKSDEPVEVRVEIANNSGAAIALPGDRGGGQRYRLLVTDAAGKPRARSRDEPPSSTPGPVTVLPDKGRLSDSILVKPNNDAWEPGVYTIRIDVVLLNNETGTSDTPPRSASSQPVQFTIGSSQEE